MFTYFSFAKSDEPIYVYTLVFDKLLCGGKGRGGEGGGERERDSLTVESTSEIVEYKTK